MIDLEETLDKIKNGVIGVGVVKVAEVMLGVPVSPVIEGIGGLVGIALGAEDKEESESHSSSTSARKEPQHNEPLLNSTFSAAHNSSFGMPQGVMSGGSQANPYNWDNIPQPKTWILPEGDGREFWNSDYSENDNYSEITPNVTHGTFYESIKTEIDNCESCIQAAESTKDTQNTIKPKKPIPQEVQAVKDIYIGKSPMQQCGKYETDMPLNSCFKCNGGQQCDHLAHFDGTHRSHHCVYPRTRSGKLTDYHNPDAPNAIEDFVVNQTFEPISEDTTIFTKPTGGKPLKHHKAVNKTKMTGIELLQLRALVDKTLVDDKESLWAEVQDHIDWSLTFAENKANLEEYLSPVMPMQPPTQREIKDTEALNAQQWQEGVSERNWENAELIESLKNRAAMGDTSAAAELELLEIQKAEASFAAPAFEPAQPIEPTTTSIPLEHIDISPVAEFSTPIETSWCSSTPETIEFSKNFVPPTETVGLNSWSENIPSIDTPVQNVTNTQNY